MRRLFFRFIMFFGVGAYMLYLGYSLLQQRGTKDAEGVPEWMQIVMPIVFLAVGVFLIILGIRLVIKTSQESREEEEEEEESGEEGDESGQRVEGAKQESLPDKASGKNKDEEEEEEEEIRQMSIMDRIRAASAFTGEDEDAADIAEEDASEPAGEDVSDTADVQDDAGSAD